MIALRPAGPKDAPALAEIYRPYVETTSITFETIAPTPEDFARRIAGISAGFPFLLAEADGEILGYAYAHPYHERAAFHWTVETSIYLRMDLRGRHIGAALYGALLPLLEAQGVLNACAVVTIPNEPSIGFHKAMGFSLGGVLPDLGYKLGDFHSVAYLTRRLSPETLPPEPLRPFGQLPGSLVAEILAKAAGNPYFYLAKTGGT